MGNFSLFLSYKTPCTHVTNIRSSRETIPLSVHKASFNNANVRTLMCASEVPFPMTESWGPQQSLRSSLLEYSQLDNNSNMEASCLKTQAKGYWAVFISSFFFTLFFLPLRSPHCRLHASPSSQRIYRGEKDLKGLGKKSSIVYWFYNRLSAREIKCGAGGAAWSTRGDGVTNTRLTLR